MTTLDRGAEALTEAAFRTGDYAEAELLLRAALTEARATGDRATEAAALDRLGWLLHFTAIDQGLDRADPDAEQQLFAESLTIRRQIGDRAGEARSLFGLALVHQVLRGDWAPAVPLFREALALADTYGDLLTASEAHRHLGFYLLAVTGETDEGLHHVRASLDLRERFGDPRWTPSGTLLLGQVLLVTGARAEALTRLGQAVEQSRAARLRPARIEQAEEALRSAERGELPPWAGRS